MRIALTDPAWRIGLSLKGLQMTVLRAVRGRRTSEYRRPSQARAWVKLITAVWLVVDLTDASHAFPPISWHA